MTQAAGTQGTGSVSLEAAASRDASLRVWRGDASGGGLRDYTVPVNEGEVVLDVLHRLQATQAPDLAVRWNCKAGKCGSCSAEVNGRPRLMCLARMGTFTPGGTFDDVAKPAFRWIEALDRETVLLGQLRDTLMPALTSGAHVPTPSP